MFTGEEEHAITFQEGGEITKRYRDNHTDPDERIAVYFSKRAISSVLDLPNCVGIRIYFGYTSGKELEPIIVGVNESGNDLVGPNDICLDLSVPCPQNCSNSNILNT